MMRRMDWAVTVLPQPLSPTTPNTSPRRTVRLTPSTARMNPSSRGKDIFRSLISKNASFFIGSSSLPRIGIGRVTHSISNETECHDGQDDTCYGREQTRVERDGLDILRILKQYAPGDHRCPQTQPNER